MDDRLTMGLSLFAATWTAFDQTTSAILDSLLGIFLLLGQIRYNHERISQ